MSLLNTLITRLDGKTFDLNKLGVVTRDFSVHSPEYEHVTHDVEGRPGHVTTNTSIKAREITVSFYVRANDNGDFAAARAEVFMLFESSEPFYIADGRQPNRLWLVRQDGSYEMDQQGRYGFFDVTFISDIPYSRSLHKAGDPLSWDAGTISWGDGYEWDGKPPEATFSTNAFTINNMGNTAINSISTPMTISLRGVFATGVTIRNKTTGDVFQYTGSLGAGDVLTIAGVRVHKNGTNVFAATNHKIIKLAPRLNEIEITGGTVSEINFDFYYYNL